MISWIGFTSYSAPVGLPLPRGVRIASYRKASVVTGPPGLD